VIVILAVALGYGGWRFYVDRQTVAASVDFDGAVKSTRAASPRFLTPPIQCAFLSR